jgi:hypothetical protein
MVQALRACQSQVHGQPKRKSGGASHVLDIRRGTRDWPCWRGLVGAVGIDDVLRVEYRRVPAHPDVCLWGHCSAAPCLDLLAHGALDRPRLREREGAIGGATGRRRSRPCLRSAPRTGRRLTALAAPILQPREIVGIDATYRSALVGLINARQMKRLSAYNSVQVLGE